MPSLETDVARFSFYRAGDGSPVVLLPGAGGWRLTFDDMARVLSRDHTVWAVDPPGQGLTTIRDGAGFRHDVDAIAHAIASFMNAIGLYRASLVGHSWGGGFALRFAQLYPQRVRRIALLAPGGVDVPDAWAFRLLRAPVLGEVATRFVSKAAIRYLLGRSFAHRELVPEDRIGEAVRELRSGPDRDARLRTLLRVERSVSWLDTERDLHLVRVPVLLLWGDRDRYLPHSLMERFVTRLPIVLAVVLSDCGHSLHDDCPEQTYAYLSPFLRGEGI